MEFSISDGEHQVVVDYPLPGMDGDLKGMTPLRMLLASLAGCSGSTVSALLRRDGQAVRGVEVVARGQRRDEHPTIITEIDLAFTVHGDVDPDKVEHVLRIAEEKLCPVWAMVKAGTPVSSSFSVAP